MLTISVQLPLTEKEETILRFVLTGAARGYYEQSPGFPLERGRQASASLALDQTRIELARAKLDLDRLRTQLSDAHLVIADLEKQIEDDSSAVPAVRAAPPAPAAGAVEEVVNQCDGCMAGRPVNAEGNHEMGWGEYRDLMACQRARYLPEEQLSKEGTGSNPQSGAVASPDGTTDGSRAGSPLNGGENPRLPPAGNGADNGRVAAGPAVPLPEKQLFKGIECPAPECPEHEPCPHHASVLPSIRSEWKRAKGKRGVPTKAAARSAFNEKIAGSQPGEE